METPRRSPGSGALRCCTDVRSTIPSGTAYATEPDHRLGAHAKTARLVLGIAELALFGDVVGAARWSAGVIIVLAPGPHRLPPTSKEHGLEIHVCFFEPLPLESKEGLEKSLDPHFPDWTQRAL